MAEIDQPHHATAVRRLVDSLDAEEMAAKSNALTGGCLRPDDARKVASMVALAAMRTPGLEVAVAGFKGHFLGGELTLTFAAPLGKAMASEDGEGL